MPPHSQATWSLFDAKARLSELVTRAQKEGPQSITKRGQPAVVVVSQEDFEALSAGRPSFKDALRSAPGELVLKRVRDGGRKVEL